MQLSIMKGTVNLEIVLSIVAYSFCSGTLLLLNKMTLHHFPYPSLVTCFQLISTLAIIMGMHLTIQLPLDPLKWKFIVPYSYYIVAFALGVYCNMRSLSQSNVETVIVFKALSPCLVAFLDAMFLGREFPSQRSWTALGIIVLGAFGYASQDEKFQTQGYAAYAWPFAYLLVISFEMAYGKSLLKSVDLKTQSGPVVYTNLLGIPPMMIFAALGGEYSKFQNDHLSEASTDTISATGYFLLFLSCLAGTGIGYSSWWCRGTVSATSFTLIGVMNKCLTILLNILVWDQHAQPMGIASLFLCLVGGSLYRQAPMRKDNTKLDVALDHGGDAFADSGDTLRPVDDAEAEPLMDEQAPDLEGNMKRRG